MESAPPIPSAIRPLSDIEGIVNVRRKLFAPRRKHYLRLNGAVLSAYSSSSSNSNVPDWQLSVLHASIEQSSRRHTITLTLPPQSSSSSASAAASSSATPPGSPSAAHSDAANNTPSNTAQAHHNHNNPSNFSSAGSSLHFHSPAHPNKLHLHFDLQNAFNRWVICLQLSATRDFNTFYHLKDQIGEGAFATVHRAICLTTGKTVAVKKVIKNDFDIVTTRELNREMFAMKHLHHKLIISSYDIFNTLKQVYIVMDYMEGGTMKDRIQSLGGKLSEHKSKFIIKQVLEGLLFLHKNGYVHRDIKLENILCYDNKSFKIKIADFGYVNFIQDQNKQHPCLTSLLGTPVYIAPEIIKKYPYGIQVDIYAVGIMLYRMISGYYPYDGKEDDDKTLQLSVQARLHFSESMWRTVSSSCKNFIKALLNPDPAKRLTAKSALLHPWLNENYYQVHRRLKAEIQPWAHVSSSSHNEHVHVQQNGGASGMADVLLIQNENDQSRMNHQHQLLPHIQPHELHHLDVGEEYDEEEDEDDDMYVEEEEMESGGLPVSPVTPAEAAQKLVRQLSPAGVVVVPKTPEGHHIPAKRKAVNGGIAVDDGQGRANRVLRMMSDSTNREAMDLEMVWFSAMTKLKRVVWVVVFARKLGVIAETFKPCEANRRIMEDDLYSDEDEEGEDEEEEGEGVEAGEREINEEDYDHHVEYNVHNNEEYEFEEDELGLRRRGGYEDDDEDDDALLDEELTSKADRMESRRRKSGKRASLVAFTRKFGRASSFHNNRRSRRFAGGSNGLGGGGWSFGDRLKRTLTLGIRR